MSGDLCSQSGSWEKSWVPIELGRTYVKDWLMGVTISQPHLSSPILEPCLISRLVNRSFPESFSRRTHMDIGQRGGRRLEEADTLQSTKQGIRIIVLKY